MLIVCMHKETNPEGRHIIQNQSLDVLRRVLEDACKNEQISNEQINISSTRTTHRLL